MIGKVYFGQSMVMSFNLEFSGRFQKFWLRPVQFYMKFYMWRVTHFFCVFLLLLHFALFSELKVVKLKFTITTMLFVKSGWNLGHICKHNLIYFLVEIPAWPSALTTMLIITQFSLLWNINRWLKSILKSMSKVMVELFNTNFQKK